MLRRSGWLSLIAVIAVVGFLAALPVPQVEAIPISFTFAGTGSGTVGTTPFSAASFVITANADTVNIVSLSGLLSLDTDSATIGIAGIGTATFNLGSRVFGYQSINALGFSRAGLSGNDLMDFTNAAFATYDLASSFGPLLVGTPFGLNSFANVPSTLGDISFSSAGAVTFTARIGAAVPEPASLLLLSSGLAGLGLYGRKYGRKRGASTQT